jgi:hypothetical protein
VRDALGLDLDDFGAQTLSKYIRGRLAAVPKGLIEALSARYGVARDELEAMAVTPAKAPLSQGGGAAGGAGPTLQFVMGHTAWAASLLITLLQGSHVTETGIRLASRGCRKTDNSWLLDWKVADGDAVNRAAADDNLEPLSAPTVAELLETIEPDYASEDIVTFGVLPWEIAGERQFLQQCDGHYIRLATLMDSAAACSIIVPAKNEIDLSGQAANNTLTSGVLMRWLSREAKPFRRIILAEQGTVSGEQAKRIAELAEVLAHAQKHEEVEVVWEHCPTANLEKKNWDDLAAEYGDLAAIVTWDPQATGFVQRSRETKTLRYNLVDVHGRQGGPGHTTLDVVLFVNNAFRRTAEYSGWRSSVGKAVERLFTEILPAIQRREGSLADLGRANRDAIEILESYFDFDAIKPRLSTHEIARIFANLRFSASIDPSGMVESRRIAPTTTSE